MMDADYTEDIALIANTHTQAKSQLPNMEQAAGGLHMNANKTEYMSFKQEGAISTLNGGPLKLVNKFICLSSSVSSTVNIYLGMMWTLIDRLSFIWKSDLSDKIGFLASSSCVKTNVWMPYMDTDKTH